MSCPPVLSARNIDGTSAPIRRSWETAVIGGSVITTPAGHETPMRREDERACRAVPLAPRPTCDDPSTGPPDRVPLDSGRQIPPRASGENCSSLAAACGAKRGPVWTTGRASTAGERRVQGGRVDEALGRTRGRRAVARPLIYVAVVKPRIVGLFSFTAWRRCCSPAGRVLSRRRGRRGRRDRRRRRHAQQLPRARGRRRMTRTSRRPTATGRVAPAQALTAGLALVGAGVAALFLLAGGLAAALAAAGAAYYVVVYTLMFKPRTALSAVPGALAGVFPPLIGWAAAGEPWSALIGLLCAVIVVWSPPHFWALALARADDYVSAGVPVPASAYGARPPGCRSSTSSWRWPSSPWRPRRRPVRHGVLGVVAAATPCSLALTARVCATGPADGLGLAALQALGSLPRRRDRHAPGRARRRAARRSFRRPRLMRDGPLSPPAQCVGEQRDHRRQGDQLALEHVQQCVLSGLSVNAYTSLPPPTSRTTITVSTPAPSAARPARAAGSVSRL